MSNDITISIVAESNLPDIVKKDIAALDDLQKDVKSSNGGDVFDIAASDAEFERKINDIRGEFDALRKEIDNFDASAAGAGETLAGVGISVSEFITGFMAVFAIATVAVKFALDEVEQYADAVEKTPDLFTEDDIKVVEEYRESVSEIHTSWLRMKASIGQELTPAVSRLSRMGADWVDTIREGGNFFDWVGKRIADTSLEFKNLDSGTRSYIAWGESIEKAQASLAGILDITASVGKEMETYAKKQDSLRDSTIEMRAKIDEATIQFGAESEEVIKLQEKLDELNEKTAENTEKFEKSTNTRILKRAEEILAEDGLTVAEELALVDRGVAMGVYTDEYAKKAREIIENGQEIADSINGIPTHHEISIVETWTSVDLRQFERFDNPQYASGTDGWETVPGASGEPYPVILHGGENFAVIPEGQSPSQSASVATMSGNESGIGGDQVVIE
ncbi:MAG: hypothetical protein DSY80_10630, partial [Desulfocapsa sp.]